MRNHLIILLMIGVASCQLAVSDRVSLDDFDFSTTDPSELFFKNVRQSDYELEERTEARMNVFRISPSTRGSLGLYPAIIHHWALDKAYVWLEPGSTLPQQFELDIQLPSSAKKLRFDGKSPMNHAEVATEIFHAILDNGTISIEGRELMPAGSPDRENFRIVLNDYYRLVELK